ncbi:hypothetical protein [Aminobacter ciceronei]|uniref:Uncharacterized protein n=1 Tax=Aminobacter ciceronei TaxID=150723 RepID=A0ABR6C9H7_9HYPH|nr:hypothetical protein [Aminobacter ciceronei]MBA8907601.1 hypothetical protein [Aminobacter ciceronei]MBA9021298.1 hypothetical protein [Aminobacter ciceronei]
MLSLGISTLDPSADDLIDWPSRLAGGFSAEAAAEGSAIGLKLADVTGRHMAATQKASDVVTDGGGRQVSEEAMALREVIMYRPADHRDSIGKLVYIAAYLIARSKRLDEEELATILEMAAPVG